MPKITLTIGLLLVALGITLFAINSAGGKPSFTALIPSMFGLILGALGLIALKKPNTRSRAMHAGMIVALLGIFGSFGGVRKLIAQVTNPQENVPMLAPAGQTIMCVLCIVLIVLGIQSFITARRSKPAAGPSATDVP